MAIPDDSFKLREWRAVDIIFLYRLFEPGKESAGSFLFFVAVLFDIGQYWNVAFNRGLPFQFSDG